MALEQVNHQQLAIAANLSANEGLKDLLKSEFDKKTDNDNNLRVEESTLKKALDGKTGKVGIEIIAGLAAKLAQTMPTAKLLNNLQDEFGFLTDAKEEDHKDQVNIKSFDQPIVRTQKQKQDKNSGTGSDWLNSQIGNQQKAADVKEFIGAYSQLLVSGGSDLKKKVDQLENRLVKEKEIPVKDLQGIKLRVANSVRSEVMQQVKNSFLKLALTPEKSLDYLISKKEVDNFIDYAFNNDKLGGYDFGGYDGHLQGAADSVKSQTHQELREFVKDELTKEVIKKSMDDKNKEVEKNIDDLLKLGKKIGLDLGDFIAKIPKMKDDLGLNPAINFEFVPAETDMNNNNGQSRHQYQYTPDEEKGIYTDKLRAIYLHRALHGDSRSVLETQFKMMKLKNGMIRLGVKNFDEIEGQGKALAKLKLLGMLKEGFEERATYAKLSGEAWKMTERKIKTVLRNLEKLGVELSQTELDSVRDRANRKMHQEAEQELSLIQAAIEARGEIKYLTTKKKMAVQILERLALESGLQKPGNELKLSVEEAC